MKYIKRDFDIDITITARVLPKVVPCDMSEKIMWKQISSEVNFEAQILAKSFKDYLEYKAEESLGYKKQFDN